MENLDHAFIGHEIKKRLQINTVGHWVDNAFIVGAGNLNQAQYWPESCFSQKLCIYGDILVLSKRLADFSQFLSIGNYFHFRGITGQPGQDQPESQWPLRPRVLTSLCITGDVRRSILNGRRKLAGTALR